MLRKIMLLVFIIPLLAACSSKINLIDPLGRPMPDPSYRAMDSSGSGLAAVFYFVKYKKKTDLDGTSILTPQYLEWRKKQVFNVGDEVEIFVEMYNEKEIEYIIYDRISVDAKIGVFTDSSVRTSRNGVSNQIYRQYRLVIPTTTKAEFVVYNVEVSNTDGDPLFRIGPFKYSVE